MWLESGTGCGTGGPWPGEDECQSEQWEAWSKGNWAQTSFGRIPSISGGDREQGVSDSGMSLYGRQGIVLKVVDRGLP